MVRPEAIVPPTITTQPKAQTVAEGAKATFKVVASGTDPLTYQWQYSKNGTSWMDKAGATSASYTVTAKASYNGLYYRCRVSNAGGEIFSSKAKLTVTSTTPVLTGATAAPGQITVKWNTVASATKYAVYRKAAGAASWTRLTNTATGTSYTDKSTDLKAGTTYYYTVRAYVGGTWGGYDNAGVGATAK
ncbi:MAG: immunoglobulin domain-containing protein [Oscillospiraceae bacterium]|nr:immunoglobulin domain-containing protein [Oscillospiraceae bacterium]